MIWQWSSVNTANKFSIWLCQFTGICNFFDCLRWSNAQYLWEGPLLADLGSFQKPNFLSRKSWLVNSATSSFWAVVSPYSSWVQIIFFNPFTTLLGSSDVPNLLQHTKAYYIGLTVLWLKVVFQGHICSMQSCIWSINQQIQGFVNLTNPDWHACDGRDPSVWRCVEVIEGLCNWATCYRLGVQIWRCYSGCSWRLGKDLIHNSRQSGRKCCNHVRFACAFEHDSKCYVDRASTRYSLGI